MKIVHVATHYWPVIGGLENVVKCLAEGMARLGHEVHVITSVYGAEDRPREEEINSVYIHRVKAIRLRYPDLTIPREIPKEILKQADIVHVHSHNSFFNIRIAEKAKYYGAKVAVHFMAVDALSTHPDPLKRILGSQYQKVLTCKALRLADLKLVKSLRDQEVLKEKYNINTVYIPDGIDEEYLRKPKDPDKFRRKYHIKEDEQVFLYIGRLHPAKGPQILVKAIPFLRQSLENFRVVLIGPGSREWLIKMARKLGVEQYVLLTGPVEEELKISAIDASTCVVVPSLYDYVEVFSLVTSEAWARGKLVVASAVGELPYRIKHGVNGLLVSPNNSKALAEALILATKHKFRIIKPLFTWQQIAEKLCVIYRNILE